ncbi:MAG TPA: hypothetical protein ENI62_07650 [Gammaproteobacteria bacterium]|nr:hypothetical protein [Gammaproteobacteria bacterium]
MTNKKSNRFVCLYNVPGEGLVAELKIAGETLLFSRQGLQYRLLNCRQAGDDSSAEEQALERMNALGEPRLSRH